MKLLSKNSYLCDHNPPTSQTDGQTTSDRKTALCTIVHRAVKTVRIINRIVRGAENIACNKETQKAKLSYRIADRTASQQTYSDCCKIAYPAVFEIMGSKHIGGRRESPS